MRNTRILVLVEVGLSIALAVVLNYIQIRLPINFAGGSISLAMLPITIVALRRGLLSGGFAGLAYGLIDFILEPVMLMPIQVVLDYPLPYLLFGLGAGLFSQMYNKLATKHDRGVTTRLLSGTAVIVLSIVVGGLMRLVCHAFSGVFFFAEYAADFFAENPTLLVAGPMDSGLNVWIYSLGYNIPYLVLSLAAVMICALIVMPVLAKAAPVVTHGFASRQENLPNLS